MSIRVISPDQSGPTGVEIYWLRITDYIPGATLSLNGSKPINVDALLAYEAPITKPWRDMALTGTVTVEYGAASDEAFPGPVNQQAPSFQSALGPGALTVVNEIVPVSDLGGVSSPALFDQTSAVNTALDTGILDVSAWRGLFIYTTLPAAGQLNMNAVDDAGVSLLVLSDGAATSHANGWGPGCRFGATSIDTPLPRRVRFVTLAVAALTSRLRIEGRR